MILFFVYIIILSNIILLFSGILKSIEQCGKLQTSVQNFFAVFNFHTSYLLGIG